MKIIMGYDSLLLRFNLRNYIYVASIEDNDTPVLRQVELTDNDLKKLGVITEAEYKHREANTRTKVKEKYERECFHEALIDAWRNYYRYGSKKGFPKPTVYPAHVQKFIDKINWTIEASRHFNFRGVRFVIARPK